MQILIVDDHTATVTFMRIAFESAGHTVTTSSSVDDAIACARFTQPDVVISDLTFRTAVGERPGIDDETLAGLVLARTLRSEPATARIGLLAVSGADSATVVRRSLESGFDEFVSKPVDVPSLLDRVDQLGELVAARR